jgi:hypothetical protein
MDAAEFVYDIEFVIAGEDDQPAPERQTLRVRLTDPNPQPGYGPALGYIHVALRQAIRETDPDTYARIGHPDDLVILRLRTAAEADA